MHKHTVTLLLGALVLVAGGSLVLPQFLAGEDTPIVRWNAKDEVDVPPEAADPEAAGAAGANAIERSSVDMPNSGGAADERVEVILRGRVIDKFKAPVAAATVWLDYGRGGGPRGGGGPANRQRRVPDPVSTDNDGRFAFQGQTFRNLRVWLQVAHDRFAVGQFDKDVGSVGTEVDLGDLVLMAGGELRGRVTDLEGNGIPLAELRLQPENNNPLRLVRDREKLLPAFTADQNGYYRRPHLANGDWSVTATAKLHTEGRSGTFAVEEDQVVDVDDIRLGPGFEVTGYVRNTRGEPIAKATVSMQSEGRARPGGRGGPDGAGGQPGQGGPAMPFAFGGGREHRTTTDAEGRFFLEHLPGVPMRLQADAEGYLDYRQDAVDTTLGQPLLVAMQDGLRIEGTVKDAEGKPVTMFAFRATRLRGLPPPGQASADLNNLVNQLRTGNLDEATRAQLTGQIESLRAQFGGQWGGMGGRQGRGPGAPGQDGSRPDRGADGNGRGGPRDLGKPEDHPDGKFVASGLQEGIYEVHVQSPEHARYQSAEVELRSGAPVPQLTITLDAGVYVAGVVLDTAGEPVRGARVELRTPSAFEGLGRRGRNGGGNRNGQPTENAPDMNGMAREFMRMASGTQLSLETTTNAEGLFIVKHAPRGTYRLHADAKSYANASTEPFDLTADRSGFELRLGALGSIAGTVRGLRPEETGEARILVLPIASSGGNADNGGPMAGLGAMFGRGRGGGGPGGGGLFQNSSVQPDGTYRVDDLLPGQYLVRCWVGSTQDFMRDMAPRFMDGTLQADAAVRGGEVTRLDLSATRPEVGTVAGTVTHNGVPATGFQVELSRQDENAGNAGGPGRGGRGQGGPGGGGFGGFGRTFQSAIASSGRFTIASVPPGNYRLRVQSNRRGGALHEEIVAVVADATTERSIAIQTHTLRGAVTRDDGGNAAELAGRVSLLPGITQLPENLGAYQRENPGFEARLQNGTFQFEALKPGGYLLVVAVRGRERTSMPIVVQGDQSVSIAAGKPTAAGNPPTAPNAPNAPNSGAPRQRPSSGR